MDRTSLRIFELNLTNMHFEQVPNLYLDRLQKERYFPLKDLTILHSIFQTYSFKTEIGYPYTYLHFQDYYKILPVGCECPITLEYSPLAIQIKKCGHRFGASIFECSYCPLCRNSIFFGEQAVYYNCDLDTVQCCYESDDLG